MQWYALSKCFFFLQAVILIYTFGVVFVHVAQSLEPIFQLTTRVSLHVGPVAKHGGCSLLVGVMGFSHL